MARIIMTSEAATLAPPSDLEALAISEFTKDKLELDAFREEVLTNLPLIARDLDAAVPVVRGLFTSQNRSLEERMVRDLAEFKPWWPASLQPRILARGVNKLPSATRFVKSAFHITPNKADRAGDDQDAILSKFLHDMFLDEVRAIRASELAADPRDTAKIISKIDSSKVSWFLLDSALHFERSAKLLDIRAPLFGDKERWAHHIVMSTNEVVEESFREVLFSENPDMNLAMQLFSTDLIARRPIDEVTECRRYENDKTIRDSLEIFKKLWIERNARTFIIPDGFDGKSIPFQMPSKKDRISSDLKTIPTEGNLGQFQSEDPRSKLVEERLQELDEFAEANPGKPVSDIARELFPGLEAALDPEKALDKNPLPNVAPATWKADKQPGETPPAFVKRVYGEWLGSGLDRAGLRKVDPALSQAIDNWSRRHEWPADVDLPTRGEQNRRWVERVEREGLGAVVGDASAEHILREGRRLAVAKHRQNIGRKK